MSSFEEKYPSNESYWRAVILFGNNVASYKFALGKALLSLANEQKTFVSLEELAVPFSQHIVEHIKQADKQGQRPTGPFLEACRKFAREEITIGELHAVTVRYGFQNVIDAFHRVNRAPIPTKFFVDERASRKGLTITDELLALKGSAQYDSLPVEVEARWRLVETAWELNVSRNLLQIKSDDSHQLYVISRTLRRKAVTPARDALNGYQKGKCFYCSRDISIDAGSDNLADVDHFYPWSLSRDDTLTESLNGIWNLVLACHECNRGAKGKSARIPAARYLERLAKRNNFLIASHHPLRETLIMQTGATENDRARFLRERDREAEQRLIHRWSPEYEEAPAY